MVYTTYTSLRTDPEDPGTYVAPEIVKCNWCGALVAVEDAHDDSTIPGHTYWHEGG